MNRRSGIALGAIVFVLATPIILRQVDRNASVVVVSVAAKPQVVRDSVSASGSLIYEREARLSPLVIGRVTEVLVKEGDHVEQGQVVLRIDDAPFRAAVEQQGAAMREQEATVQRQRLTLADAHRRLALSEKLEQRGFLARSKADDLRLEVAIAQADVQRNLQELARTRALLSQADQELMRTVIRAPMSASVTTVSIKPGETAVPSATGIPGSSLVTIADLTTIVPDLDVDESDVTHLQIGQQVQIYCPPLPGISLSGTIRSIGLALRPPTIGQRDTGGRKYSVKVNFTDSRIAGLRPGMECRATIYTSQAVPKIAVPVQAIRSSRADDIDGYTESAPARAKSDFVFVVEQGQARRRFVKLGKADSVYQQIVSGLSLHDEVIIGPYQTLQVLRDGQRVRTERENHPAGS